MARTVQDALRWVDHGTKLAGDAIAALDEAAFDAPTGLPGWTRRHLVAHLTANADAVHNLVHWASSGEPTPMYASPEQRASEIEAGSRLPAAKLRAWFDRSAATLAAQMRALTRGQWDAQVVPPRAGPCPRPRRPGFGPGR